MPSPDLPPGLRVALADRYRLERAIALAPSSPDVQFIVADAYTYGTEPDAQRAFDEATFALGSYRKGSEMSQAPFVVGGIPIPSDAPAFLVVLGVHVLAGLGCVLTGLAAMFAPKGPSRHAYFGTLYYRCLLVVFATMAVLSAVRWAENYHLFVLGTLAFAAAFVGRRAVRHRRVRRHLFGMGSSYILLLTAFYVDNGAHLPLWRELPTLAYWLLPAVIGIPLIVVTLRRHPLAQAERGT